jgi:hypothetical protein
MATYVEMRTDGFARNLDDIVDKKALDFEGVRRPLRGVEIKDDTYAIIKVIRSDGKEVPLVDSGSKVTANSLGIRGAVEELREVPPEGSTFNYSNFIAQQVIDAAAHHAGPGPADEHARLQLEERVLEELRDLSSRHEAGGARRPHLLLLRRPDRRGVHAGRPGVT